MRETLPKALKLMFGHEGGYVNARSDRGGPTKYGITHKTLALHRKVQSVTPDQVRALTLQEAEDIYRRSYWSQSGGDVLPVGLDYAAFDFGVNSGPSRAVKVLQQTVGVTADGQVGQKTLAAVNQYPGGVVKLIRDYCAARMAFLRSLKDTKTGFPVNGRGWTIRVTGVDPKGEWASVPGVVGHAVQMAMEADTARPAPKPVVSEKPTVTPAPAHDERDILHPGFFIAGFAAALAAAFYFLGG